MMHPREVSFLAAATEQQYKRYRSLGLKVLTAPLKTKGARVPGWAEMSPDEAARLTAPQIDGYTHLNLAICTCPGLSVIDLDGRDGVDADLALQAILTLLGPEVAKRVEIVKTPRGYHLYMRFTAPVADQPMAMFGGDCFGGQRGHQVMVPPSIHPDGSQYLLKQQIADDLPLVDPRQLGIQLDADGRPPAGIPRITIPGHWSTFENLTGDARRNALLAITHDETAARQMIQPHSTSAIQMERPFNCVVHPERHPSAALHVMRDLNVMYHDFHFASTPDKREWWSIVDVLATIATGRAQKLRGGTYVVWLIREAAGATLFGLPEIHAAPLTDHAPPSAHEVHRAAILLFQCRAAFDPTQEVSPMTWRFIADWGNTTQSRARYGMNWLLKYDYLRDRGRTPNGMLRLVSLARTAESSIGHWRNPWYDPDRPPLTDEEQKDVIDTVADAMREVDLDAAGPVDNVARDVGTKPPLRDFDDLLDL